MKSAEPDRTEVPRTETPDSRAQVDLFSDAFRAKHPDCDALLPVMEYLSYLFQADWSKIRWDEYLEALYCIAKNAEFVALLRAGALYKALPPGTADLPVM